MNITLPEGIIVPLMPLLTEECRYDFPAVQTQLDYCINGGVAGVFALANCGQAPYFSFDENKDLVSVVAEAVGRRVPLYVGAWRPPQDPDKDYQRKMLEHAQRSGAEAAVVLCEGMNPDAKVAHFRELKAQEFPIIAYTVWPEAKRLQNIEAIMELDHVVGLKATIGFDHPAKVAYFNQALRTGKPVYQGEDEFLYDAVDRGARGGVNAIANLVPVQIVNIIKAFNRGEKERACRAQYRINQLLGVLYHGKTDEGNPIDPVSALYYILYLYFGEGSMKMKAPRRQLNDKERRTIHRAIIGQAIEPF